MRKIHKISTIMLSIALILGLTGPMAVSAATTPSLGLAATYGILASTYTNTTAGTTINGDIGFTTGPAVVPLGTHTNYGSGAPYATAGADMGAALATLNAQACTFTFGGGAIDLSTDTTHGDIGVYAPGVYCSSGAMNVGGPLTLSGSGTFIFRPDGALTSTVGATVTLSGASACDVFWTSAQATTLAANTTFAGNIISDAGITFGGNTTLAGRALSFGGTVTTDTDTITVPTCAAATASINVVKTVVNDNGRNKTVADFPLFVDGTAVVSGVTNIFPAPASYTVTESGDSNYTQSFSGDCDINGNISLNPGENKFCIITNNDEAVPQSGGSYTPSVPPLINVVKVPSPLALPDGPGLVKYTYTLTNIGTVRVTNITMVGDTCSPIVLDSGDLNNDLKLDLNETWVHSCSTMLTETHTNTIVATGWANGISATDIASATVVVGLPVVPPLIHITKVPSPLTLLAGGGMVTYTKKVTNPGTVALSNVTVTDDKCSPLRYISGDANGDAKLDTIETWIYTCATNLTNTTTNTAVATGEANGLIARDFAIATVVVSGIVPKLPNTGIPPSQVNLLILVGALMAISISLIVVLRKKTN